MSKYVGNILTDGAATGYSCGFNGSSTSLSVADNAAFEFGSGDFTMEAWIYTANAATRQTVIAKTNSGGNDASSAFVWQIGKSGAETTGLLNFYHAAATTYITASTALSSNTWYHIAIVRSGNTFTQYINGTANGTASISTAIRDIPEGVYMGAGLYGVYFNGAISNLRIVKGTAVYTGNFTPPTQLFAITNTSLLTCQQPTIIDTSSNAFAITNTGGVTVSNLSPFPAYQAYNPASGGGTPGIWSLNDAANAAQNQSWNMYDPYWKNTTLLLNGENAANAAQNNTFLDSSANNFTITRNGNTTQGTFSPYGNLWSNYINGASAYLSIPNNSALNIGSSDFTFECWVNGSAFSTTESLFFGRWGSNTNFGYMFLYSTSGGLTFIYSTTGSAASNVGRSYGGTLNPGVWYHVAFCRSSGVTKAFINGVQVGTSNDNVTIFNSSATQNIGIIFDGGSPFYPYTGYISNLRMMVGTALYTSNFTPSTTPLTAVSGTSLLTCQSNRFIDNSSNNFAITVNGNTSVQRFSPFNPTAPYSANTIGGSGYFDGSGDYLVVGGGSSNAYNFGTGNATVEAWINTTAATGVIASNFDSGAATVTDAWRLLIGHDVAGRVAWSQGSTVVAYNSKLVNDGAWHHVAAVINGGSVTIYVDGIGGTSASLSGYNYTKTTDMYVGAYYAAGYPIQNLITGYIANLRINKGNAVYTTNFTPPTAPVTAISGTTALLNFTNAGIPDAAMINDLETVGNAQVSTSVKKYGMGSLYFDGSGDYLYSPSSPNYILSGDFTVEGWVYLNSTAAAWPVFTIGDSNTSTGIELYRATSTGKWRVYSNNAAQVESSTSTGTGSWVHLAVVRSNGSIKLYVNGTNEGSSWSSTTAFAGAFYGAAEFYGGSVTVAANGYIDDLRITKGVARYTANFTPPTSSLQNL